MRDSRKRPPSKPFAKRRAPVVSRRKRIAPTPVPKVLHHRAGPLHVEIVVVGRELLRGVIADVNGTWLAGWLSSRGALVHRITVVDDVDRAITEAVGDALARGAHFVVTTGGLGPTADDRTLGAVADALRLPLTLHPPAKAMVEDAYRRLKGEGKVATSGMTAPREKLATIPVGSEPIPNPGGASPGVLVRLTGRGAVLCLPGVPAEARATFENAVPRLSDLLPRGFVALRELETPTADESALRFILDRVSSEYPGVWVKSHPPGFRAQNPRVRVTIESFAASQRQADHQVDAAVQRLLALAGAG